jgi:HAE1 family hydrophobic/amphiphilic exporter-1
MLSVVLVYMLMVALFESWLTPFAIMFSLPVALVGAFAGLYLSGNTFNIFSMIGTIMLMGLAGKNAILLVDFTNNLRGQGMERSEALIHAGFIRLRPILMTTATIVFAMLPLALKLEEGGESRSPLAVVVMGGVVSSTVLTLVLVPSVYSILDDAKVGVGRLRERIRSVGRTQRAPILPAPVRGAED